MTDLEWSFVDAHIPRRAPESDKNNYGRVLLVCGSVGYTGAAYFAAMGAIRMGAGVVTLATPEKAWQILAVKLNDPVVRPVADDGTGMLSGDALPELLRLAGRADAMLIGSGLGRSNGVAAVVRQLVRQAHCQIVLDADGINAVCMHKDILQETAKPVILTPHAKEFHRLSGIERPTRQELSAFAHANSCVLLYKGHRTLIAGPDGAIYRNMTGNPGMAKGGSGDVLAGMIVSLCGQGFSAVDAACVGAFLHGKAGDLAANAISEYGMTPNDLLNHLVVLLRRYNSREW